eukprot:TRINITY_DN1217_c2_g1_i3.p1 TRINITY_DN1217_c2_g1~~TRINITY_DN1217_c2_g1_i3.p1  ORF type:complete len:211 (-),score=-1.55 TRINITY_DN1217_c2_g1_i3:762-1394(-)
MQFELKFYIFIPEKKFSIFSIFIYFLSGTQKKSKANRLKKIPLQIFQSKITFFSNSKGVGLILAFPIFSFHHRALFLFNAFKYSSQKIQIQFSFPIDEYIYILQSQLVHFQIVVIQQWTYDPFLSTIFFTFHKTKIQIKILYCVIQKRIGNERYQKIFYKLINIKLQIERFNLGGIGLLMLVQFSENIVYMFYLFQAILHFNDRTSLYEM